MAQFIYHLSGLTIFLGFLTKDIIVDYLYFIVNGEAQVCRDGKIYNLGTGSFIGEISFLLEGKATATVLLPKETEVIRWKQGALRKMFLSQPHLKISFTELLNEDLASKIGVTPAFDGMD